MVVDAPSDSEGALCGMSYTARLAIRPGKSCLWPLSQFGFKLWTLEKLTGILTALALGRRFPTHYSTLKRSLRYLKRRNDSVLGARTLCSRHTVILAMVEQWAGNYARDINMTSSEQRRESRITSRKDGQS